MENLDLHEIQLSIMEKLGYRNKLRFSDLQGSESSNKISFHLKQLQDQGFIEKDDQKYKTLPKGKEYLAYLEQEKIRQPLIINHVLIMSEDSVYLNKREDSLDPFPGALRGIVLRTERGESMARAAEEAFKKEFDETKAEAKIIGVMRNNIEFKEGFSQHYISFFTKINASLDKDQMYPINNLDEELLPGLESLIKKASDESKFFGEWDIIETEDGSFELGKISFD